MTRTWAERTRRNKIDKTSFAVREIARRGHLIHKLTAKDSTGRRACYFVLVEPHREKAFFAAIAGDSVIDLEDFGRVIASNYGEEPSECTRTYLKDTYGFDV
jgi:hypothetical protein